MLAPQSQPWRSWYGLRRWRNRAADQIRREPLCAQCLADGRIIPANVADHNPPHNGVWNAFRLGPLQSLCFDCHKRKWANDAHGYRCDIGDDGLPVDPNHPFNVRRPSDGGPADQAEGRGQPGPPRRTSPAPSTRPAHG
jgi:5-methylcytosine-specific restriction endonuclease McrA